MEVMKQSLQEQMVHAGEVAQRTMPRRPRSPDAAAPPPQVATPSGGGRSDDIVLCTYGA
jgi:hypothetical protein